MASKLQCTAYHEAGHAVAAYLTRRSLKVISIIPNSDNNTLGLCVGVSRITLADVEVNAPGATEWLSDKQWRVRRHIEACLIFSIAGIVAESLFTGRNHLRIEEGSDDAAIIGNLISYISSSDEDEISAYLNWLWERTRVMLIWEPHWAAVQALADKLLKRQRISGRLARKTIIEAWRAWAQAEIDNTAKERR